MSRTHFQKNRFSIILGPKFEVSGQPEIPFWDLPLIVIGVSPLTSSPFTFSRGVPFFPEQFVEVEDGTMWSPGFEGNAPNHCRFLSL